MAGPVSSAPEQAPDGHLCVGLMSGTSADGVDAALVRVGPPGDSRRVDLLTFVQRPYPSGIRDEVFAVFAQESPAVARLCSLNFTLGELFADAALAVCRQAGVEPADLHVVGSHGQTVWHQPEPDPSLAGSRPSTLQVGEPAVIAARTGAPVVADFRVADMAVGGQGAPLVPYFDWAVLRDAARNRAIQNLGGIANVTYLRAGGALDEVVAFDTGPGNMVIDGLVTLLTHGASTFDRDGTLAAAGTVDAGLLGKWLDDPYFDQAPPRTTGRERYGLSYARWLLDDAGVPSGALLTGGAGADRRDALDLIATATALTARSIACAYRRWLPPVDQVVLGGGGSRNPTLRAMLAPLVAPARLLVHEDLGIDGRAKEAMAFALLAHDGLAGLPTNVPSATGARRAVSLGKLVRPG
ncbi:MAG TPA: anhydro-N-acetylmuramic acid kinase [Thermomicrobiaceae bacterium]|nr:anhydro-N-acetylmuramic acid kinase [Thermomicrobiaceae bacterium]